MSLFASWCKWDAKGRIRRKWDVFCCKWDVTFCIIANEMFCIHETSSEMLLMLQNCKWDVSTPALLQVRCKLSWSVASEMLALLLCCKWDVSSTTMLQVRCQLSCSVASEMFALLFCCKWDASTTTELQVRCCTGLTQSVRHTVFYWNYNDWKAGLPSASPALSASS